MSRGPNAATTQRVSGLRQIIQSGANPRAAQKAAPVAAVGPTKAPVSLDHAFAKIAKQHAKSQQKVDVAAAQKTLKQLSGGGGAFGIGNAAEHAVTTALDVPRRVVQAGIEGLGQSARAALGEKTDFSHVGQALEGKRTFGTILGELGVHGIAQRAGGFVGDVAADPLTWLAPEAATAHSEQVVANLHNIADAVDAGKTLETATKLAKNADTAVTVAKAAEKLGPQKLRDAAARVARTKSAGALSKDELAAIGAEGGIKFLGKGPTILPNQVRGLTGGLRGAAGDALDKLGGLAPGSEKLNLLGKLRGGDAVLNAAARSGDTELATAAFKTLRARGTEAAKAAGESETAQLAAQNAFKNVDEKRAIQLMEDPVARATATPVEQQAVSKLQTIYDTAHQAATDAGVEIGHQENYFPRVLEDVVKEKVAGGAKHVTLGEAVDGMLKSRKLGQTEFQWLGETIPEGLTQAEQRARINEISQRVLGSNAYREDAKNITGLYLKGIYNKIGEARTTQRLVNESVLISKYGPTAAKAQPEQLSLLDNLSHAPAANPVEDVQQQEHQLNLFTQQEAALGEKPMSVDRMTTALRDPKVSAAFNDAVNNGLKARLADDPTLAADPEFMHVLERQAQLSAPRAENTFTQHWDRFVNYLKRWQVATPGFYARNTMGGVWLNDLHGMDFRTYGKWFQADNAFNNGFRSAAEAGIDNPRWVRYAGSHPEEAAAYLQSRGVMLSNPGQYGGEIAGEARNPLLKGAHRLGIASENATRAPLAMDVILKGGTLDDAVAAVDKFHFHFGKNLSSAEKNLRRIIPFYTFTRYNVPLQLEYLVKHPRTFAVFNHFQQNLGLGVKPDAVTPQYFGDLGATPTGANFGGGQVYYTPNLPNEEAFKFLRDPQSSLPSMLTPLVKTPAELIAGKQFYKGIPFTGARHPLPSVVSFLGPVLAQAGLAKQDASGAYTTSDKVAYSIDQFFPLLARVRRQAPNEKRYQDRATTAWLNFVFGNQLRTNTLDEQQNELNRRKTAQFFATHKPIPLYVNNKAYDKYQKKKAARAAQRNG